MVIWQIPVMTGLVSCCALLFMGIPLAASNDKGPVLLTSKWIELSDGKVFGMNGHKIGRNKKLRFEIVKILVGSANASKQYVGLYTYKGTSYSVRQLVQLESAGALPKEDLDQLLYIVKQDCDKLFEGFMADAAGLKKIIFALIKESCEKRNRNGSFLLTWGEAKEEADRQLFHDKIRTFAALDEFLTHLQDFLQDLTHSCPLGRAQWEEINRKNEEKKQQQKASEKRS